MLIIVDGVDKSGKSTFASALARTLHNNKKRVVTIKSFNRPLSDSAEERQKVKDAYVDIWDAVKIFLAQDYYVILDRFHSSEMVYSILRGYDAFEDKWFKEFDKLLTQTNSLFILCNTSTMNIKTRLKKQKDEYIKINSVDLLSQRYNNFFKWTAMNNLSIFETSINLSNNLKTALNAIKEIENGEMVNELER